MVGTGYVGLGSGACMADFGHAVTCVDINEERIAALRRGVIPFYEPGLDRLGLKNVDEERLQFTTSLAEGMKDADVILIASSLNLSSPSLLPFPGTPRTRLHGGTTMPSLTTALAPITEPAPIFAPLRTTAFMPIIT